MQWLAQLMARGFWVQTNVYCTVTIFISIIHMFSIMSLNFVVSVLTPEEAMKRYQALLLAVRTGRSKTAAYQKVGVDRKTIADMAAMSELHAVDENAFKEMRSTISTNDTLSAFSARCRDKIKSEALQDKIEQKKK